MSVAAAAVTAALVCAAAIGKADAATVNCPGTLATTDREFSLTTTPGATCLLFGPGNISGSPQTDPFLKSTVGAGFQLLDKTDDTVSGLFPNLFNNPTSLNSGLSGAFSFNLPPLNNWTFAIGFKSGNGQLDPDWAIFLLPDGVTSGTWAISGKQALSHVNLYGIQGTTVVPLPVPIVLLGSALFGLGLLGWRRRMRTA